MDEIILSARRKIVALLVIAVLSACAFGAGIFFSVRGGVAIKAFLDTGQQTALLERGIMEFSPRIEEAKRMGAALANVRYPGAQGLREVLFRELEGMGLSAPDISLRERNTERNRGGTNVPDGIIEVTASGFIPLDKIPLFVKETSSRSRVWGMEFLEFTPRVSPAGLVSQFMQLHERRDVRNLETFTQQGREFLEDKSPAYADVKMRFIVVGS